MDEWNDGHVRKSLPPCTAFGAKADTSIVPGMPLEPSSFRFDFSEPLALHGGPKAKRTPFPPRKRHGDQEKRYLAEVIDSDMLFYFTGSKVYEFQKRFAAMYGRKH